MALDSWLAVIFILIFFSSITYFKKALDFNGILMANIIGAVTFYLGGLTSLLLMVLFFVVAEFSTRYARLVSNGRTHRMRTTGNVLGNSGAALLALLLNPMVLNIAFFGAMAAALSDTISGEIGLLSKKKPRLISNFQEVAPGTDGGITLLGCLAGLGAAFLVALFYFLISGNLYSILVLSVAGLIGSLVDSLLGATLERKGLLNNTSVNFLASGAGALVAYLLFLL